MDNDGWLPLRNLEEKLRELRSYCLANASADDPGYFDVADRLSNILDGEK